MMSLVIPTRNEEKNIAPLLESLKKQTYKKKFEVIVVDGKSTDRTVEISQRYGARVILQKGALGVGNARNLGGKNARGSVIIFCEADYIFDKNFLKNIERYFKEDIDAARPNVIPVQENWLQRTLAVQTELCTKRIGAKMHASIFRKNVWEKLGRFDESLGYGDERLLPEKALKEGYKVKYLDEAIIYVKPVKTIKALFKQGRWYGRNVLKYVKKSNDYVMIFGIAVYSLFIPVFLFGLFYRPLLILSVSMFMALFLYGLWGLFLTRSVYSFLIPLINIIRGFGELIGIIETPFMKHRGK